MTTDGEVDIEIADVLRRSVADTEDGADWLASLPRLVAAAVARWDLTLGRPFEGGMAAWTAPARTDDGVEVVLKVSLPHAEARDEGTALLAWGGVGAAPLLAQHRETWALLLGSIRPGGCLRDAGLAEADHLAAGADVLDRLHRTEADLRPFTRLTVVATHLAAVAEARLAALAGDAPIEVDLGLCRAAIDAWRSLPNDTDDLVLLHGDLNPGNILDAGVAGGDGADRWVAIDPKPLVGDAAFDPWPLLTQVDDWTVHHATSASLADRARLVGERTGLDPARMAVWGHARSVESALWAADRGWWTGDRGADGDLARAAAWAGAARLLGG